MGAIAYVAAAFFLTVSSSLSTFLLSFLSASRLWRKEGEPKKPLLLSLFPLSLSLQSAPISREEEEERGGGEVMDQLSLSLLSFLSCGLPPHIHR